MQHLIQNDNFILEIINSGDTSFRFYEFFIKWGSNHHWLPQIIYVTQWNYDSWSQLQWPATRLARITVIFSSSFLSFLWKFINSASMNNTLYEMVALLTSLPFYSRRKPEILSPPGRYCQPIGWTPMTLSRACCTWSGGQGRRRDTVTSSLPPDCTSLTGRRRSFRTQCLWDRRCTSR